MADNLIFFTQPVLQAAIKQQQQQLTLSGPIRAQQKNPSCTVIGLRGSWGLSHISKLVLQYSNRGQASPTESTDVQRSFAQRQGVGWH